MWIFNTSQGNMRNFDYQLHTSKSEQNQVSHYSTSKIQLKPKKCIQNVQENQQESNGSYKSSHNGAISSRSMHKKGISIQTIHDFYNGRLLNFNSQPELAVSNNFDFSFQNSPKEAPLPINQGQNKQFTRYLLWSLISPKLFKLDQYKNRLQMQCLNLKRQIIEFQSFKTTFFEHFARKAQRLIMCSSERERKDRKRLNDLLLHSARDLEHSQTARVYFSQQNSKLQLALIQEQQIIDKLRSQVKKQKLEVAQLKGENEKYLNQTSQLQATIVKLTQSANQDGLLREELNKTKEQINQLESRMRNVLEEKTAFEKDITQHRKEIEVKIKQGWSQLKEVCDHLLSAKKIREGFSQLEEQSRYRSQLAFLKSKAQQKIGSLMTFQNCNYIKLTQLERDDTHYKLNTLLSLMSDIKSSVFDQLQQSHGLLDYYKNCKERMANLIQNCNKSLGNEACFSRPASYSVQTSRKTKERPYTRQMSRFFPKQSISTAQSHSYRILNDSCSESNIGLSRVWSSNIERTEAIGKMSRIQQRLNTLRRQVRQSLKKII